MIQFVNSQKAFLSNLTNGNPSSKIRVIGVTGTYGKTPVAHLIYELFKESQQKVGLLSSFGYTTDMENFKSDYSADKLEAGTIHKILNEMVKNGLNFAVVELTPNNLRSKVYDGLALDSGVITNIVHNEPEYRSFDEYAKNKLDFINKIRNEGYLVLHYHDDNIANWMNSSGNQIKKNVFTYLNNPNDISEVRQSLKGSRFKLDDSDYQTSLVGNINLNNAVLALRLAQAYLPTNYLQNALPKVKGIQGRMEVILNSPFTIIIDSSYTPDAIGESLKYLDSVLPNGSNLITVVGGKGELEINRREIGSWAAAFSSMVVLAADDPRSEKVYDINSEIHLGAQPFRGMLVERIGSTDEYNMLNKFNLRSKIERVRANADIPFIAFDADDFTSRYNAIDFAISYAQTGDVIYIAGKGNDLVIEFNKVEYEWNDAQAALEIVRTYYKQDTTSTLAQSTSKPQKSFYTEIG